MSGTDDEVGLAQGSEQEDTNSHTLLTDDEKRSAQAGGRRLTIAHQTKKERMQDSVIVDNLKKTDTDGTIPDRQYAYKVRSVW